MGDRGLYKRGGIWYIRFADQSGKIQRESSNSPVKNIAKQLLAVRKSEVARGKFKKVEKRDKVLFKDYAQVFLRWAKVHLKPAGFRRYRTSLTKIIQAMGERNLDDIRRQDIETYKETRSQHVSNATLNRDLACIRKLYNNAIADGLVDSSPIKSIGFLKEPKRSENHLSDVELKALLKACDREATKTFVTLAVNTGMRLNELLSLKWDQIDLENNLITLKDTKNNKEDKIPINDVVVRQLNSCKKVSEYVICQCDGSRYYEFRYQWKKIVKTAGIKWCTPHVLRHTWATMLVKAGVDLQTVQELGRWSELKLVLRYSHVNQADHRARAAKVLEEKFPTDTKSDTVSEKPN